MRVPVRVKDDDGVSRLEVEAQPPSTGAEEEDEVRGVLGVEHLQHLPAVVSLGGTVQTQVVVAWQQKRV